MTLQYLAICTAAFLTSGLTLFSGFGLGTLLMPVFAVFFPLEAAVAMTAVVHFLNNLFKLGLVGRHARRDVVLRFGVPAIAGAFAGAKLLVWLGARPPLFHYSVAGRALEILPGNILIAALMIAFAVFEMAPAAEKFSFKADYLPLGGILSGFFGGLSGHQGAFRSAFLVRAGLPKESFIGCGVVIACLVDLARLSVYGAHYSSVREGAQWPLLAAATFSAFLGAFIASRFMKKITFSAIQKIVAALLVLIAVCLGAGIL